MLERLSYEPAAAMRIDAREATRSANMPSTAVNAFRIRQCSWHGRFGERRSGPYFKPMGYLKADIDNIIGIKRRWHDAEQLDFESMRRIMLLSEHRRNRPGL